MTFEIDDLGRVVSRQFGDLALLTASFNGLGQLETLTHGSGPLARVTDFSYDTDGFRKGVTDPLGRSVTNVRDAAGRITTRTLPGDVDIGFGYNVAGELNSIVPPGVPEHVFTYTQHGQIANITPPAVDGSGPTTFAYNDDRQVTSITSPGNEEVSFNYDAEGRVQTIELLEGGLTAVTYSMTYMTANQLDTVTGPGAQTVSYGYQGDLITSETWGGLVEGSVSWAYDNTFRLASETVTGGSTINYGYDDDDLLTSAGSFAIMRSAINGLAESANLGVVNDAWTYNEFGEVESNTINANAVTVYDVSYTRDDLGRITQKVEAISGVTDTYDYDYDLRGQLIEVQKNSVVIESYSYDDNGNRTSATVDSVMSTSTYDAQDRLISYGGNTYTYTPAGQLLARTEPGDLVTTYDYDVVGNLRSVTLPDATEVSYGLDGPDRRVQRAVDGTITHRFLFDGYLPVAELDVGGNVVSQFIYAGGSVPSYMSKGGINYRLVTDQVGSVRLVVNADTGAIAQRIDYDAFGNVLSDTDPGFQPFGFAGGLYDPVTGLVRFGFRDYEAEAGRWTSKDPIGMNGEDSNLYRYVNNNPVNLMDSLGLSAFDTALGFLNGLNQGILEALNPALAWQHGIESLTDYLIGDWLDRNGFYRDPNPGKLTVPPPGVDPGDYADGEFYGSCTAGLASLGVGGIRGAPTLLSRLGGAANRLKQLPGLAKRLAEGAKGLFKRSKPPARGEVDNLAQSFVDDLLENGNFLGKVDDVGGLPSKALPSTPGKGNFGGSGKSRR